jgi:hypothetical protein
MTKFSALTLTYCNALTQIKVITDDMNLAPSLAFLLTLGKKNRITFFRLLTSLYVVLTTFRVNLLSTYNYAGWLQYIIQKIQGLLKDAIISLAGYAVTFKRRFYLSGQVNRFKRLSKNKLTLQLGYSHKVRIRTLQYFRFRRWRRKKFGLLVKTNSLNSFSSFSDFFRHLRLRGKYTGRGVRIKKDRFKMKFRPDHGKYGFKMNY